MWEDNYRRILNEFNSSSLKEELNVIGADCFVEMSLSEAVGIFVQRILGIGIEGNPSPWDILVSPFESGLDYYFYDPFAKALGVISANFQFIADDPANTEKHTKQIEMIRKYIPIAEAFHIVGRAVKTGTQQEQIKIKELVEVATEEYLYPLVP